VLPGQPRKHAGLTLDIAYFENRKEYGQLEAWNRLYENFELYVESKEKKTYLFQR